MPVTLVRAVNFCRFFGILLFMYAFSLPSQIAQFLGSTLSHTLVYPSHLTHGKTSFGLINLVAVLVG